MEWLLSDDSDYDSTKITSPTQIVNRIDARLEELTGLKKDSQDPSFDMPLNSLVTRKQLSFWYNGWLKPEITQLVNIAKNLNMDLNVLLGNKEGPNTTDYKFLPNLEYNCLNNKNKQIADTVISALRNTQNK